MPSDASPAAWLAEAEAIPEAIPESRAARTSARGRRRARRRRAERHRHVAMGDARRGRHLRGLARRAPGRRARRDLPHVIESD